MAGSRLEAVGYDERSLYIYVELFWLGMLAPSAVTFTVTLPRFFTLTWGDFSRIVSVDFT